MVFQKNITFIYFITSSFLALILLYLFMQGRYVHKSELNYTHTLAKEVETLIALKRVTSFEMAQALSSHPDLIKVMKSKEYEKLYTTHFFPLENEYTDFKNIALHVVDATGHNRYLSWTHESLGDYILEIREDLATLYKNPKPTMNISVGKFDITFKGIMPIYDENHTFLGIIETITHFNSITEKLALDGINSAVIIEKKYTSQLKFPFSKTFIDGYNISTVALNKNVKALLETYGVESFITQEHYRHMPKLDKYIDGYYVVNVDIKDQKDQVIGHFLVFAEDQYGLAEQKLILNFILILIVILFFMMLYLVYKVYQNNLRFIDDLNDEVRFQTEQKMRLVYTDNLTQSYTKEKFEDDQAEYINEDVVMLNIKNFSQINETYGYSMGDEVLKITAKRLESQLKRKIYRIDADEFLFKTTHINEDIKAIKEAFIFSNMHIPKENITIRLSFSFSVVHGNENDLLRKLTIALKCAKKEPFQDYVMYEEHEVNNEFIQFNSYLYDAIFLQKEAHIIPYFQGIRNNESHQITKYEALARLNVKGRIYSPYYFIEIAKNSGFLFEITKIMIDKSLGYLSQRDKNIEISINITEEDLLSKQLKSYLLETLNKYGLDSSRVTLEILEGISSGGTNNNIIQLKELKELGFQLAIDDFGVEYSNFERINELDIDFIKIDGKYIKNVHTNPKSFKIVKAISDFAHSMQIDLVAEFVEDASIQTVIETLGIEYSQGYHFSQPCAQMNH